MLMKKALFAQPILGDVKNPAVRAHGCEFRGSSGAGNRDIFKFKCNHLHLPCEFPDTIEILIWKGEFAIANLAGRRIAVRRIDIDPVAKLTGSDGEHASQLAPAQDT